MNPVHSPHKSIFDRIITFRFSLSSGHSNGDAVADRPIARSSFLGPRPRSP
jgi:hypothetical protein